MSSSVSDPTLQSLQCSVCSVKNNLKCCSRCRAIYYCSRPHQQLDWKRHRIECQQLLHCQSTDTGNCVGPQPTPPDTQLMATSMTAQFAVRPERPNTSNGSILFDASIGTNSGQNPQSFNELQSLTDLVDNQNNDHLISKQDLILTKLNSYCESIVRDLNEFGFCVIDDFLSNGSEILSEVLYLYKCGLFRAGQLVNNKASDSQLIRGDLILWADGTEPMCANIGFLVQTLDSIVMRCNTMSTNGQFAKYHINRRTKAMIACYPGNASKYVRHIDNPNNDGRCITSIYYLNKDYNRDRDGGVLRLFPQISSCVADIEPKFNRVIFFWSDRRNPHEVMASTRMRFAITVWYFDAIERERAIQRYKQERLQYPVDKDLRPF